MDYSRTWPCLAPQGTRVTRARLLKIYAYLGQACYILVVFESIIRAHEAFGTWLRSLVLHLTGEHIPTTVGNSKIRLQRSHHERVA